MTFWLVAKFIAGMALLVLGAEGLVRGASRLAASFGISRTVIGLTVVAFGTSAPELAVSLQSTLTGLPEVTVGNVVGSNICNVLLILGLSAAVAPLAVEAQVVRRDVPLMIGASALLFVFALDGVIGRLDGSLLFVLLLAYTGYSLVQSRREGAQTGRSDHPKQESDDDSGLHPAVSVVLVVVGLFCLVRGADWLVDSAVLFARQFGVSELIIGLTLVAGGTSLPELATSAVAAWRGEREIAVGNVVGSNLFNLLLVLGLTGAVAPAGISVPDAAIRLDLPVMLGVALLCLPVVYTGRIVTRREGFLCLSYYAAYVAYLFLKGSDHAIVPLYAAVVLFAFVPVTLMALLLRSADQVRHLRRQQSDRS